MRILEKSNWGNFLLERVVPTESGQMSHFGLVAPVAAAAKPRTLPARAVEGSKFARGLTVRLSTMMALRFHLGVAAAGRKEERNIPFPAVVYPKCCCNCNSLHVAARDTWPTALASAKTKISRRTIRWGHP